MFFNKIKQLNIKDNIDDLVACDIVFFSHDVNFNLTLNNKAYSALLDSVREDLERRGWKTQTISHPFSTISGNAAHSNPILINKSYLLATIKGKIFRIFTKTKNKHSKSLYSRILTKCNPKCIILIGAPSALCSTAHSMKIPCIELLHGIGFTFIEWGYDKRQPEELPTGFLSLDSCSTKTFQQLNTSKVLQIPHPFLKRFQNKKYTTSIPSEWKINKNFNKGEKIILVSLQWGYDGSYKQLDNIIPNHIIADKLICAIESSLNKNIIWAFRLHPVQLRSEKYKHHVDFIQKFCEQHSNTQWQWSTEMPLPIVLQKCTGHITMSSMSSYEAAYMGIKTLALCPTLRKGGYYQNMFSDLEEAGYLTKAQADTQSIINWVEAIQPIQPFLDNLADEEAWENAVEWMLGNNYKDDGKNY